MNSPFWIPFGELPIRDFDSPEQWGLIGDPWTDGCALAMMKVLAKEVENEVAVQIEMKERAEKESAARKRQREEQRAEATRRGAPKPRSQDRSARGLPCLKRTHWTITDRNAWIKLVTKAEKDERALDGALSVWLRVRNFLKFASNHSGAGQTFDPKTVTIPSRSTLQDWLGHGVYDAAVQKEARSKAISLGRLHDPKFDHALAMQVLYLRAHEIAVKPKDLKVVAKAVLQRPEFVKSPAKIGYKSKQGKLVKPLTFSDGWARKVLIRHRFSTRKASKTHITKADPSAVDANQAEFEATYKKLGVVPWLNSNDDETPAKCNNSSMTTLDAIGKKDVRIKSQGKEKEQLTAYLGGYAGGLPEAHHKPMPEVIGINDFDRSRHLKPAMFIVKGRTAAVLVNVLKEMSSYTAGLGGALETRSPREAVPPSSEAGSRQRDWLSGTGVWGIYVRMYPLTEPIIAFRKAQLQSKARTRKQKAATYIPFIRFKAGHILTCTPSGWNITETEAMFNELISLCEAQRRRTVMQMPDAKGIQTKDNYAAHVCCEETQRKLEEANIPHHFLAANSTCQVQWCDTDINSKVKTGQALKQGSSSTWLSRGSWTTCLRCHRASRATARRCSATRLPMLLASRCRR